jgi:hypothetical protein
MHKWPKLAAKREILTSLAAKNGQLIVFDAAQGEAERLVTVDHDTAATAEGQIPAVRSIVLITAPIEAVRSALVQ